MLILSNKKDLISKNKKISTPEGISCFLIKKEIFLKLSGFDEKFFYIMKIQIFKKIFKKKFVAYKIPVYYDNFGALMIKSLNFSRSK